MVLSCQPSSTMQQVANQLDRVTSGEESTAKNLKLRIVRRKLNVCRLADNFIISTCINSLLDYYPLTEEAPPLIPALTSGRYDIQWTQLADLPAPLYNTYVAVQHHKIYVTGNSPVDDAKHQVYVYNINTDQWGQLPPPGHYYGIPHIIGGRLAIIGGRLSATKKMTNKVSTFDEDSQIWSPCYPDLLSVRVRPGVINHLEYVIVAGGGRSVAVDDTIVVQDDIEVLNWIENSHWRKVSIKLPEPMYCFMHTHYI